MIDASPVPTDPTSLAFAGLALLAGVSLVILKNGGFRTATGARADPESSP